MSQVIWLWGPRFHTFIDRAKLELSAPSTHIAVDGGVLARDHLPAQMIQHWWAVGDGDSGPANLLDEHYPRDKSQSDLTLALKHDSAKASRLRAIGLSGGRADHHMIVLGCLWRHLEQNSGQIRLDDHWQLFAPGHWQVDNINTSTCSLMPLTDDRISLFGSWRWNLERQAVRPLDDLLLSNEITPGKIEIKCDKPIILWSECGATQWWERV